jgi:hypothetical protein
MVNLSMGYHVTHMLWGLTLTLIFIHGPGLFSVDFLLAKWWKRVETEHNTLVILKKRTNPRF